MITPTCQIEFIKIFQLHFTVFSIKYIKSKEKRTRSGLQETVLIDYTFFLIFEMYQIGKTIIHIVKTCLCNFILQCICFFFLTNIYKILN